MRFTRGILWMCALGLGACAAVPSGADAPPQPATPLPSLTGTRWVGVVDRDADHRTLPRLEFVTEGRLSGYTGCNMLSGSWRVDGERVRIERLVTTKRLCVGPEGDTERRLLAAMGAGSRVERHGGKLSFIAPGGARFEFVEAAAT
jgi:heat shock protein HslJ